MIAVDTNGVATEPSLEDRLAAAQAEGLEPNLRRTLAFVGPEGAFEFQALGCSDGRFETNRAAHSRSTRDALALCTAAETWTCDGVYVIPAQLRPGVETRRSAPGNWRDMRKGEGTTDSDVAARLVLGVDCDVKRPSRISATDAEMMMSVRTALEVYAYLATLIGDDAIAYVHSGNGRQLWIALGGLPANEETKLLAKSVLAGLDAKFSTADVAIDLKLSDAKRLLPACGTVKKKGAAGIAERPHRRTAIATPEHVRRLSLVDLQDLRARIYQDCDDADRVEMDRASGIKPSKPSGGKLTTKVRLPFDQANDLDPGPVAEWLDLFESGELRCPGCGESQGVDVIDHGLKCMHDRCNGKGREGFRTNVDLVAEVRGVEPREAVNLLAERFGFEGFREPAQPKEPAPQPDDAPEPARDTGDRPLVHLMTADEFDAEESAADLVVPALGICAGPPTGFVGQAYSGKTLHALSSGLSVALGRPFWGKWPVQQGPWLHLDYEQGRRHTKSRIRRLARGLGVSKEELRDLIARGVVRVAVLPDLRLTTDKAVDHYRRLFEGVRLVTCDSLRMMLGGVDENSSQVRALMATLSIASDKSRAAVGLIHHGGKTPLQGERARKETARGSSSITDEFQSMFVTTKKKGDPVALVTHEKDRELGDTIEDFGLRIDDEPGPSDRNPGLVDGKWGLRVVHVSREEMPKAAKTEGRDITEQVYEYVKGNPGINGADALAKAMKKGAPAVRASVASLRASGRVEQRPGPNGGASKALYVKETSDDDED